MLLEIKNLHATVDGKEVIKGLNLQIEAGQTHAIMGPNGSGKSTLSHVIAGRDGYEVTEGSVSFQGHDLLALDIAERAQAGVFLAFQYPVEIPGVTAMNFVKESVNAIRKAQGKNTYDAVEFLKKVKEKVALLKMDGSLLKRSVNQGFSGGEKKRFDILQMIMLEPVLSILDETDSGLDIDALKEVSEGVNLMQSSERGFVVITHYQRLLNYIEPDVVHILADGKIITSGGKEIAQKLEAEGYAGFGVKDEEAA